MEILQEGLKSWQLVNQCSSCKAILKISDKDIFISCDKYYCEDKRFYEDPIYKFVYQCPCCKVISPIKPKQIPGLFRHKAIARYVHKKSKKS